MVSEVFSSGLIPRPRPAFRHLQYGKMCGESLGTRLPNTVFHEIKPTLIFTE